MIGFNFLSKVNVENKAYIEAVKPSGFVRVFGKAVRVAKIHVE